MYYFESVIQYNLKMECFSNYTDSETSFCVSEFQVSRLICPKLSEIYLKLQNKAKMISVQKVETT